MILVLAVVNHFGVGWGAVLQNISTFAKVAALGAIVLGGFVLMGRAPTAAPTQPTAGLLEGFVRAAMAIFWAYEGWYQLPFNAAELKDPHRDLPRGLIYGTLLLIVIYVLVNAAYLQVIPIDEMRTLGRDADVPHLTVERVFGAATAGGLAFLLCLSVFGAANPGLLSTPRAFYAMAQDGLAWRGLMWVHPRWRTPTVAIWTQAVWSIALIVVLKTFRDITDFVIFAALLFYALTVASIYVQRRRLPDRPRAYRCWGYPVTPAIFIAVLLFVDFQTLLDAESRMNSLYGLAIIAAGALAYAPLQRLARR
jgi:APA family basic amino acid/polyamine antiporter